MSYKETSVRRNKCGTCKLDPKLFNLPKANVDVKKNGGNIELEWVRMQCHGIERK